MGFNKITNRPKQILRPMSRQPLRPGQWNGHTLGTRNTTYIQNNFYGPQMTYRGWDESAWAGYRYDDGSCNSGSKTSDIMGFIGLITGGIGKLIDGISNIFSSKKSGDGEEQGGEGTTTGTPTTPETTTPATTTPTPTTPTTSTQATTTPTPTTSTPETPETETPETTPTPQANDPDAYDWDSDFRTSCRDVDKNGNDSKGTSSITGDVKVTEKDENNKAPKKFTITTAYGYTYQFEKVTGTSGNDLKYKCTGYTRKSGSTTTNKTYTTGNVYVCEMRGGKPVLLQKPGMKGQGESLNKSNS